MENDNNKMMNVTGQKNWVAGRTCVHNIGYHIVWSTKYRRMVLEGHMA